MRYNGQHDIAKDVVESVKTHFTFHIHYAIPENLNDGRYEKHPSRPTTRYASFNEAINGFMLEANVGDYASYFPELKYLPLLEPLQKRD